MMEKKEKIEVGEDIFKWEFEIEFKKQKVVSEEGEKNREKCFAWPITKMI